MDIDWLDEDGYPTDEALERISNWEYAAGWHELMELIHSLDRYKGLGWRVETVKNRYSDTELDEYHFSTGGWSGNESLVYALKQNAMFWSMCWQLSERGGHHVFRMPKKKLDGTSPSPAEAPKE